jgi:hypothetical protein
METKPYLGEHDYGEWSAQTEATCTEAGVNIRSCTVCKVEETADVPELGHDEVITPGNPATCTEDGSSDRIHCARCELVLQETAVIVATGHTEETKPRVEPGCGVEGRTEERYCSDCLEVLEAGEVIPALSHVTETIFGQDPTCTEFGLSEMDVCVNCNAVMIMPEVLDRLGHSLENGVCIRCGHTCDHGVDPQNPGKIGQNEQKTGTGEVFEGTGVFYQDVTCDQCGETSKIVGEEPKPDENEETATD